MKIGGTFKINNGPKIRFRKIREFLNRPGFNGFTKDDLFILSFIKKGWGHGIAALSNMAEAIANITVSQEKQIDEYSFLSNEIVKRALHSKVRPYKNDIYEVKKLGKYGYYLEHLNIILGAHKKISGSDSHKDLNERISHHLINNSLSYPNYHADLLPHVKMKWPADQAAILYSLWLYDKNYGTNISGDIIYKWLQYMQEKATHAQTGLYRTEVLGTRKYSGQPRGCSLSYMIHYMGRFAATRAAEQWKLYKRHMLKKVFGRIGFREFLPDYKGAWSPDSGPIVADIGVAATGLGLNAASTIGDKKTFKGLERTMSPFHSFLAKGDSMPIINVLSRIGTDLLSSAIWLNAETKVKWY